MKWDSKRLFLTLWADTTQLYVAPCLCVYSEAEMLQNTDNFRS